jgi:hypothetical protein
VQSQVILYLTWLRDNVGYAGWRYDVAKGYEASLNLRYNQATLPQLSVGEVWDNLQVVSNWVNRAQGPAFDFPLRYALKTAIGNNDYWGLKFAGMMSQRSDAAVTFLDNHDTARNGRLGGDAQNARGCAFILTVRNFFLLFFFSFFLYL